ncbi:hypothetical protein [Formosa sp. 4Alg 33]|uniref:hypothetical protein n=1 Tax=Formosa sp. 4Alg 33 TaxID=3382189 RepID=UPI003D9C3ADF
MKRFLTNILYFFIISTISYFGLVVISGKLLRSDFRPNLPDDINSSNLLRRKLSEIENYKNVDILFLGSSHAYRGFDVRLFKKNNFTSFNLGSSSQTPIQTELILSTYLDEISPKLVVFEVYPAVFCADGAESGIDFILNDLKSFKSARLINNLKIYNLFIYNFFKKHIENDNSKKNNIISNPNYIKGGFLERKNAYFKYSSYKDSKWKFKPYQIQAFKDILDFLEKNEQPYILVQAPITRSFYNSHTNNETFDSIMSERSKYVNFNKLIKLNDSLHFYDNNHLNQKGVELFNTELIKVMKKDMSLTKLFN